MHAGRIETAQKALELFWWRGPFEHLLAKLCGKLNGGDEIMNKRHVVEKARRKGRGHKKSVRLCAFGDLGHEISRLVWRDYERELDRLDRKEKK